MDGGKSSLMLRTKSKMDMSRLRLRKPSQGFSGIAGIGPIKTSQVALEFRRPPMLYLPTYRLDSDIPFHWEKVEKAINRVLDDVWAEHRYSTNGSPQLTLKLAYDIMKAVRALNFDRYRIISIVTIGQRRSQSYNNAIAMLWDHERDGYADVVRETHTCFVQVTVFGIYLD